MSRIRTVRITAPPFVLLLAAACGGGPRPAADTPAATPASSVSDAAPTFYADVLGVFEANCVECHRADPPQVGGITAPFALDDYAAARRYARRIKQAVETGMMPPWGAHEQHRGTFKGERYLDAWEKARIVAWVDAGAPEGDPADAPRRARMAVGEGELVREADEPVRPPSGWWIGEPDLVVELPEPVHVHDTIQDWQPTFAMPVPDGALDEPKWISKAELAPGGPWVHHIVSSHMGVGVPGRGPFTYPKGWGVLLPEDPFITVNMHYHKEPGAGTAVTDQTRAAFEFHEPGDVIDHVVETDLNFTRDFVIPAGASNHEVRHARSFDEDTYLLSMGPHMHLRGKAMKYELEYPDGRRETLLYVPRYSFDWQFLYEYEEPLFVPAGSRLHMTWWFDNSSANPYNPDPTVDVVYGPETTDEMANARIYFAPAEPRGLVVGEPIPPELLEEARAREEQRRQRMLAQQARMQGMMR